MDRELWDELRRYMSTAEESLRLAYNTLLDYQNNVANGLNVNNATFDDANIIELGRRILYNRDRINNIIIKEIDDTLSGM